MKKLSIITINRNNSLGLQKTIESVVNQSVCDFEYIIIDGASSDQSTEIIKKNSDHLHYWLSEPDTGIYNAMNKGILKATGEYCLFLNSGDWLFDADVVADFLSGNFQEDLVAGSVEYVNGVSRHYIQPSKDKLTYDFFVHDSLMHSATFIKRELFHNYGLYNEKYRIVSDWEFFIKALIVHNCSYSVFNKTVSKFDLQGISSKTSFKVLHKQEMEQVLSEILPRVHPLSVELEYLRSIKQEYDFLKSGRFRLIVRFLLKLKALKKLNDSCN